MRIIISPAKQMQVNTDASTCSTLPAFMEKTEILMRWIQSLSYEEQKKLWACNDRIARQNAERLDDFYVCFLLLSMTFLKLCLGIAEKEEAY